MDIKYIHICTDLGSFPFWLTLQISSRGWAQVRAILGIEWGWSADKWTTYWFHARDHNIWCVKTINFRNALFIYLHVRYHNCKWVTSVWGELYLPVDYKTCSCAFCNITSTLRTMTLRNVGTHTSWLLCTCAVENSSARCHHERRIELLLDNRQKPIVQYQTAGKTHHQAWINMGQE